MGNGRRKKQIDDFRHLHFERSEKSVFIIKQGPCHSERSEETKKNYKARNQILLFQNYILTLFQ